MSHAAPYAVRRQAAFGLVLVSLGYGGRGLTPGALVLARRLAAGDAISVEDLTVLHAYFARMSRNKPFQTSLARGPTSPASVSWHLRGGTPARAWVDEVLFWEKDLPKRP